MTVKNLFIFPFLCQGPRLDDICLYLCMIFFIIVMAKYH